MNDKNLTKKTKKELIELFKEIKEQNNSLHVAINIKQSFINTLAENNKRKDILISKQEELINIKDELIHSQDEAIRLKDEAIRLKSEAIHLAEEISTRKDNYINVLNNKLNKIVKYSIILDVCIIVSALLIILFI